MSDGLTVATIALQGAAVGVSTELVIRCLLGKRGKVVPRVRTAKSIMGLTMALKTSLFLSFHTSQGRACQVTGRLSDLLYHISITAGTFVLLARVQSILPENWQRKAYAFHAFLVAFRFAMGVVDTGLVTIENYPNGSCEYFDRDFWGPVYTLFDTILDFYVTIVITYILVSHINSFAAHNIKINKRIYTSVIYHNVIRTTCLTAVNLISAIFIIIKSKSRNLMILWPIINIFFVVLVGYDSDVTKAIRQLRERMHLAPSRVPSFLNQNHTTSNNTMVQQQQPNSIHQFVKQPVTAMTMTDIPIANFSLNSIPASLCGSTEEDLSDGNNNNNNKPTYCHHQEDVEKNIISTSKHINSRVSSFNTDQTRL
ncbi:hypothetical protein K501DRAFT_251539 [Backusella circina FSU 941]|nr:hypothetical protein K501DRAFT_251539 [Backusella circina FSU 941]